MWGRKANIPLGMEVWVNYRIVLCFWQTWVQRAVEWNLCERCGMPDGKKVGKCWRMACFVLMLAFLGLSCSSRRAERSNGFEVRFGVLTAVPLNIEVWCDASPCRLENKYRLFGGSKCLRNVGVTTVEPGYKDTSSITSDILRYQSVLRY